MFPNLTEHASRVHVLSAVGPEAVLAHLTDRGMVEGQPRPWRVASRQGQSVTAELLVMSNQVVVTSLLAAQLIPASVVFFDCAPNLARGFADEQPD